jgi:uncharacterized phage-like protein YoqJ
MALGADIWAAEAVLAAKIYNPNIALHCVLPFPEHAGNWNDPQTERYIARYNAILLQADTVHTASERYFKNHSGDAYDIRNRYMIDNAQYVIAVWNYQPSGTGKTVRYGREKGLRCTVINPDDLRVTAYV